MNVKITALRRTEYPDLMALYENPLEVPCEMHIGDTFVSVDGQQPEGLCNNAWRCMAHYVQELARGGGNFFDGWMKNPHSALVSCDDGFRPLSYLLETIEE